MSENGGGQPVDVNVGECRCPGTPHTLDSVWLKAVLDVPLAIAANVSIGAIDDAGLSRSEVEAEVQYALTRVYLLHSIERWTMTDEKGQPVPIVPSQITRLLPWGNGGGEVAQAADGLYSEALFAPLAQAVAKAEKEMAQSLNREQRRLMKKSSRNGRTAASTSVTPPSGPTPLEPSLPSSPASSAGEALLR